MQKIRAWWCFVNQYINVRMGSLSGLVMGSVVFVINFDHGFWPAFAGFWKQFVFNLFMAGLNVKTCERIVQRTKRISGIYWAAIIPTLQAFLVLYAIHYFGATPRPGASTIWQAIGNLGFFFILALNYKGVVDGKRIYRAKRFFYIPVKRKNRRQQHLPNYSRKAS